jgi:hypothetical protein
VTIVDLLNMRDEFASILEQEVIATNVEAALIVHRGLYIRNPDEPEEKLGTIKRTIGNVTKHTEITFEFGVRNKQGRLCFCSKKSKCKRIALQFKN